MLNAISSHAGERGLFELKSSLLIFLPLSAISPDAQAVDEKYLAPIRARIDRGDCPPGLRKQYELQLENIKADTPSYEIALVQSIGMWTGERDNLRNPSSSPHFHQQSPILKENMHPLYLFRINLSPAVPLYAFGIYHFSLCAMAQRRL